MPSGFSCVQLCSTPWTAARQAPLSMGFSRQECWSGLPSPPSGDLPEPGIKPAALMSPALADQFFIISTTWEARGARMHRQLEWPPRPITSNLQVRPGNQLLKLLRWFQYANTFRNHSLWSLPGAKHWQTTTRRPNLTDCFCARAKNGYYIFQWVGKKELFHDMFKVYETQISMSIYNILLKHSHVHSFTHVYGCFKIQSQG